MVGSVNRQNVNFVNLPLWFDGKFDAKFDTDAQVDVDYGFKRKSDIIYRGILTKSNYHFHRVLLANQQAHQYLRWRRSEFYSSRQARLLRPAGGWLLFTTEIRVIHHWVAGPTSLHSESVCWRWVCHLHAQGGRLRDHLCEWRARRRHRFGGLGNHFKFEVGASMATTISIFDFNTLHFSPEYSSTRKIYWFSKFGKISRFNTSADRSWQSKHRISWKANCVASAMFQCSKSTTSMCARWRLDRSISDCYSPSTLFLTHPIV